MKVFKNFEDLAQYFKKPAYEVEKIYFDQYYRGILVIDNQEVQVVAKDSKLNFVIFDIENNEECKEYFMAYEKKLYDWKVYVDDIEKWQECEVIEVYNKGLDFYRAVVRTEYNTQLNRLCKYVLDEKEIKPDGCIYFKDKEA